MPDERQGAGGGGGDGDNGEKKVLLRIPVPTFDPDSFDLYLTNLEMWSFTSMAAKEMKGALLFQSLPNAHSSGIKQRISDQIPLEDLKKETSFNKIIDILKEAFAKVKEAENYAVFKEFMYIKRKSDEDMLTYVSRFSGSKVKAEKHNIKLGDTTKAYHLLETSNISEQDKRAVLAQLVGKEDSSTDETVFKAAVAALKTILGESKVEDLSIQKLEGVLSVDEQEALAAFRYKKKYGQSVKTPKTTGLPPVQKPRNPIDPNTGMIMRCASCDAKTHLVKDCYDTFENVKARLKAQTLKGAQLIAEEKDSDNEAFFTNSIISSSPIVEEVVLQVKIKELKTLGGHTSGCMLLDSGCSRTVAGVAWMDDYRQGLSEEDLEKVVHETASKCGF